MSPVSSAVGAHLIDHQIKGSPLPTPFTPITPTSSPKPPLPPSNPLDSAPSSPSQIYLNLLILEADLRRQYVYHLARRRKFTFFIILLFLWVGFFGYRFFVLGGSPYYYVSHLEKVGLGGGIVTGVLYYATGLYHKTIVEPRRFVSMANRGLRSINVKLVKISLPTREWISWWYQWYTFRPPRIWIPPPKRRLSATTKRPVQGLTPGSTRESSSIPRSQPTSKPVHAEEEEDESDEWLPGGFHIKLVILPKGFSPDFREGWELYRAEYWERENDARLQRIEELRTQRRMGHDVVYSPDHHRRRSRTSSISSQQGRSTTPEEHGGPHRRRGSTASLKRRSLVGSPGDVSDSSTTSIGERLRRSDSVRTDRTSSSTGSAMEPSRSRSGRPRTRVQKPKIIQQDM
ncbi:Spo7-domain-containing protein [Ascodesmis nigricans]|uniref:Spo7-domain-containing protein n=1 Tax=Ascodesmis nigricans TaxID=341454 RepID=A0A4S2N2R3_9PEZI|nr:Spo7-domain-containing protein [Ascodesmis nigricans]